MASNSSIGDSLPRKKLRVGVVSERGGVNAVKALFERHRLVVQEYDTRNDYGKDLVIDLTEDDEITGAMIAAQVKAGASYFRSDAPFIPARLSDIRLWAESTIPIVGVVWRPQPNELYWVNLTERCRALSAQFRGQSPDQGHVVEIGLRSRLTDESLGQMIDSMRAFAKATSHEAYLSLLDENDEVRRDGVFACWTHGRADARPLIMLRRMLPYLKEGSFLEGLWALNALTGNPDFGGSSDNWISSDVRNYALQHLVWTAEEVAEMYHEHELIDDEHVGWQRGGSGQTLWHLLNPLGLNEHPPFGEALRLAVLRRQFDAAFRLLIAVQWLSADPMGAVADALDQYPVLNGRDDVGILVAHLEEWGRCPVYD